MGKSSETLLITRLVFEYLYLERGYRVGMEVAVPNGFHRPEGRCDLLGYNNKKEFICVEVKITLADFKSKHGHNFVGNKNYYAVPLDLVDKIKDLVPKHVGIIAVKITPSVYADGKDHCFYDYPYVIKQCQTRDVPTMLADGLLKNIATAQTSNILTLLKKLYAIEQNKEIKDVN